MTLVRVVNVRNIASGCRISDGGIHNEPRATLTSQRLNRSSACLFSLTETVVPIFPNPCICKTRVHRRTEERTRTQAMRHEHKGGYIDMRYISATSTVRQALPIDFHFFGKPVPIIPQDRYQPGGSMVKFSSRSKKKTNSNDNINRM